MTNYCRLCGEALSDELQVVVDENGQLCHPECFDREETSYG